MFKRKIVKGTVEDISTTVKNKYYGTSVDNTSHKFPCDVFGTALAELLSECGIESEYEEDSRIVWICGVPVLITEYSSSATYFGTIIPCHPFDTTGSDFANSKNTSIPKIMGNVLNSEYNFAITFVGDPQAAFGIGWSANGVAYDNILTYAQMHFYHLTSVINGEKCIGIIGNNANQGFVYRVSGEKSVEEIIKYNDKFYLTGEVPSINSAVSGYAGENIVLVPAYSTGCIFRADYCYRYEKSYNAMPQNGFSIGNPIILSITGEEYMLFNSNNPCLVKLVTQ